MPLWERKLRMAETQQRTGGRSGERCEERGAGWAGMWRIPFKDTLDPLSWMKWYSESWAMLKGWRKEKSEGCKR